MTRAHAHAIPVNNRILIGIMGLLFFLKRLQLTFLFTYCNSLSNLPTKFNPNILRIQDILKDHILSESPCVSFNLIVSHVSEPEVESEFQEISSNVIPSSSSVTNLIYHLQTNELGNISKLFQRQVSCLTMMLTMDLPEDYEDTLILTHLSRILTPRSTPSVLKDIDKLIFITRHILTLRRLLKSPKFGSKFKYKAGMSLEDKGMIYTSCEFCPLKSSPGFLIPRLDWYDYEDNFEGSSLNVVGPIATQFRFNWTTSPIDGARRASTGVYTYALKALQGAFNFSIELLPASRGGGTGIRLQNGSWLGAIGDIVDGIGDIAICTAETFSRTQAVAFTTAVTYEPITFISGPPMKIYSIYAVFWPLNYSVWLSIGLLTFIAAFLIRCSFAIRAKTFPSRHWKQWEVGKILEYLLGTFVEESPPIPKDPPFSVKLFLIIWLFCSMVITTAYLSKLVGFLTFPLVDKIPQTGDELVLSSFQWGLTYMGGAAYYLIKSSRTKTFQQIFERLELLKDIKCLERSLSSRFICIGYKSVPDTRLNKDLNIKLGQSPLIVSENYFITVPVGISMQDRAPYGRRMNDMVYRFHAGGLVGEWDRQDLRSTREGLRKDLEEKGLKPQPTILSTLGSSNQKANGNEDGLLTLKHLKGAFVILVVGIIISALGFIYERLIFCCGNWSLKGSYTRRKKRSLALCPCSRTNVFQMNSFN